ncbi:class I SAM-dependent methyltransferase [Luedemannella helvata]|uniref:Class I SAM-dependent methyltransferase n=1 Tax=Luedemannella helvata TaxID=349315 RepID=A0ABN2L7S9_9ACTN
MTRGPLLDDEALHASSVVANNAMNRERQLTGVNSYARELGFDPVDWLTERLASADRVAWLDLCCGTGRALIQAADRLRRTGLADRVRLVGVDLVDFFDPAAASPELVCAPVTAWTPDQPYELITCVHGLHYVGDKLGVLARAAGWLTDDGMLVADLDLASVRLAGGIPAGRPLASALRGAGLGYDSRRRQVRCAGRREVTLPYTYRGADDRAGPNYTGQPAVDSIYDR